MLLKQSSPAKNNVVRGNGPSPSAVSVLREGWSLVKESKALWWIGVLAGLGQGYGMNAQFSYRLDSSDVDAFQQTVLRLTPGGSIALLLLVMLLLVIWIVSVMAEAGLMKSVLARKGGHHASFRSTLAQGRPGLWPLVKFNIVVALFSLFLILLIGMPAGIAIATSTTGLFTGSIGVLLILVYGILLALLYPWMTRFVVLRNQSVRESVRSAWRLFRSQPGLLLKLGIGGLLVQVIGAVLIALILVILFVPLLIVAALIFRSNLEIALWPVLLGILAVGLLLAGILTAVKNAYYTLAFDRIHQA